MLEFFCLISIYALYKALKNIKFLCDYFTNWQILCYIILKIIYNNYIEQNIAYFKKFRQNLILNFSKLYL
jgi:hypothetical protein